MVFLNSLRKLLTALCLVLCFASVSLAAANGQVQPPDTIFLTMQPPVEMVYSHSALALEPFEHSNVETVLRIDRDFFTGYFDTSRRLIEELKKSDIPGGTQTVSLKEMTTIALHKDGDRIIWSLAPSLGKFTLNPVDDIKNLKVLLQYRLWF